MGSASDLGFLAVWKATIKGCSVNCAALPFLVSDFLADQACRIGQGAVSERYHFQCSSSETEKYMENPLSLSL